jgi:TRAP-type C4-dicarboxylate transport system permease small subunit
MKKNKKMFWAVVLFLVLGFSGFSERAWAGCCIRSVNCQNATNASNCPGSEYSFDARDCSEIDACKPSGNNSPATTSVTSFVNPIGFTSVAELLDSILNNLMGIIAILAVIFIVIGGIMYLVSAGDETMITRAKKTWTSAVIGLAIALAAPTFLKEIRNILGGGGTGGSAQSWVSNSLTIRQIAVNVLTLLLDVVGIFAIIAMVIGGGMYLTAYGDEKKIDTGKRIITYAIIGIVVALASLVIVRQVDTLLRAPSNVGAPGSAPIQGSPYPSN